MMDSIVSLYEYSLQPMAPFSWFGLTTSALDVAGAVRLCVIMRQIREILHTEHVSKPGASSEPRSFARSAAATLVVVFGGEVMTSPLIGVAPSFMVSGTATILFTVIQAFVDALPSIPAPFFEMEMPLAVLDAFTRAFLLCNCIPPAVTANTSSQIASSPWALLVTSFIAANGGFFLVNMFSFLHPTPMQLRTPPELSPYGWTTADLWCAPLITGIYALLTHAQPFWAEMHTSFTGVEEAVDPARARALCAALLALLFTTRTAKNFRVQEKIKTQ